MKKNIIIAAIAAASALFLCSSCQKQELIEQDKESNAEVRTFTAAIEQGLTKTSITSNYIVNWVAGDQVIINGKEYSATPEEGDPTKAILAPKDGQAEPVDGKYYAFFPASLCKDGFFEIPATQKFSAEDFNVPMYAVGSETHKLLFKNICGVFCFSLKGTYKVKSITLTSDEDICGKYEMADEVTLNFTGGGKVITIDCGDGVQLSPTEAKDFYMYLPSIDYTSVMTIEVTTAEGKVYWKNTLAIPQRLARNTMNTFNWRIEFPEYVTIGDLKWTKQNLAVSASGGKSWKGNNATAVKLPGTDKDAIVGDYFQWAAYTGYCGKGSDDDNGLLVYTSFNNTKCVGDQAGSSFFTFKEGKSFTREYANAYWKEGNIYSKYADEDHATLDRTGVHTGHNDDAANIVYGGNWRIPTKDEFDAMKAITYWQFDATDYGYYVYTPVSGDEGGSDGKKADRKTDITGTYVKSDALLFFPLSGSGEHANLRLYDNKLNYDGWYWSSTFYPIVDRDIVLSAQAYAQALRPNNVAASLTGVAAELTGYNRHSGASIRAVCSVSDKE